MGFHRGFWFRISDNFFLCSIQDLHIHPEAFKKRLVPLMCIWALVGCRPLAVKDCVLSKKMVYECEITYQNFGDCLCDRTRPTKVGVELAIFGLILHQLVAKLLTLDWTIVNHPFFWPQSPWMAMVHGQSKISLNLSYAGGYEIRNFQAPQLRF